MTNDQINSFIDEVLPKIPIKLDHLRQYFKPSIRKYIKESREDFEEVLYVLDVMEREKLIQVNHSHGELDYYGRISPFGIQVRDVGGWLKHLQQKKADELQDKAIKTLTLSQLEGNIFQIKYWWVIAIIGAILGAFVSKFMEAFWKYVSD